MGRSIRYPRQGYRKLTRTLRRGRSTGTIAIRAERLNHVWSWDFIADRTDDGGKLRILSILDEYSRECLALHVARKLTAQDRIDVMKRLAKERGLPHPHPQRQRERVHRPDTSGLVGPARRQDPLHRTGQPVAEWTRRELESAHSHVTLQT